MTIPSRPAPAPPGSRGQNAAAGANASLEQLRLQLQQQHMQQQQSGNGLQKMTIKLPPPPKGPLQQQNSIHRRTPTSHSHNNNNGFFELDQTQTGSNITRKFPQARYSPATNWDDAPFGNAFGSGSGVGNGNFKKMPPPRPPPPKMQANGRKTTAPAPPSSTQGGGGGVALITNIFHRKKTTATSMAAASKAAAQNRVYGLSSGHGSGAASNTNTASATAAASASSVNNYDWNAAWNTATSTTTSTTTSQHYASGSSSFGASSIGGGGASVAEAQLISFDSPPSSPTFTQKSNSDCVSVDSFSSDSNFSSPNNGSVSQPESGFEDDYHARSRPATTSPLDPWESVDNYQVESVYGTTHHSIGTAPVRQLQHQTAASRQPTDPNPLCNGKSLLPPAQSLAMPTIIKPKISQKPKAPKPPPFLNKAAMGYGGNSTPSPPMPKGAPPPLPGATSHAASGISMLDVISGKVDAAALGHGASGYIEETEEPFAIALYDFDGVEEGDLSFRENEKIYLLDQPTEDWLRGRSRTGCEGIFPANYVEIKVPLNAGNSQEGFSSSQQAYSAVSAPSSNQLPTARCLYNFPGEVEGDLALQENDLVTVLYRINEDWLFGEVAGRQGQFPTNFLDRVPENLPTF